MILRIDHVQITIPLGAEKAAERFYCDQLGFEPAARPESLNHVPGFWLTCGHAKLHIGIEAGIERSRTNAHPAFEVTDLEAYRPRIIQGGGQIDPSIPIPGRNRVEFRDSFGNRIELLEYINAEVRSRFNLQSKEHPVTATHPQKTFRS